MTKTKTQSAKHEPIEPTFALTYCEDSGFTAFQNERIQLLRFRPSWSWEYHEVLQRGASRGLPMFVRYLRCDEAERLELALQTELARRRLDAKNRDVITILLLRSWHVDVCTGRIVS